MTGLECNRPPSAKHQRPKVSLPQEQTSHAARLFLCQHEKENNMRTLAYCDRNGVIGFSVDCPPPENMLVFYSARTERACRRKVEASARHAYDGVNLLVPGVPEAVDDGHALAAVQIHRAWLKGEDVGSRAAEWRQRLPEHQS